eukprot:COSAG01_NODE_74427_length_213_cov_261.482456_1_plen_42_part_10
MSLIHIPVKEAVLLCYPRIYPTTNPHGAALQSKHGSIGPDSA